MIIFDALYLMLITLWAFFTNPPVFYFLAGLLATSVLYTIWSIFAAPLDTRGEWG